LNHDVRYSASLPAVDKVGVVISGVVMLVRSAVEAADAVVCGDVDVTLVTCAVAFVNTAVENSVALVTDGLVTLTHDCVVRTSADVDSAGVTFVELAVTVLGEVAGTVLVPFAGAVPIASA
jgi:hypothetical protein